MEINKELLDKRVDIVNKFCSRYKGESRALMVYTNVNRNIVDKPYDSMSKFDLLLLSWIGDDELMFMMRTLIEGRRDIYSFMHWCFEKHFNE